MTCDQCGRRSLLPVGPANARILLVADSPTIFDVREGQPWTGPGGQVLRIELRRVGIRYDDCRVTNMWLHPKSNDCGGHLQHVLQEMDNRPAVLLMGADAVSHFIGLNVSDINGLRVDQMGAAKEMLPPTVGVAYAMFNPALALHDRLGEVRQAFGKFAAGIV